MCLLLFGVTAAMLRVALASFLPVPCGTVSWGELCLNNMAASGQGAPSNSGEEKAISNEQLGDSLVAQTDHNIKEDGRKNSSFFIRI